MTTKGKKANVCCVKNPISSCNTCGNPVCTIHYSNCLDCGTYCTSCMKVESCENCHAGACKLHMMKDPDGRPVCSSCKEILDEEYNKAPDEDIDEIAEESAEDTY